MPEHPPPGAVGLVGPVVPLHRAWRVLGQVLARGPRGWRDLPGVG